MKFEYKKNGFTLTEVVITLVSIGIVAMLTIPSLTNNFKKHELYSRFVTTYEKLDKVLPVLIREHGSVFYWNDAACQNTLDYLDVSSECSNDSCIPQRYSSINGEETLSGTSAFSIQSMTAGNDNSRTVILRDGAVIRARWGPANMGDPSSAEHNACIFAIDTNGIKGPNEFGRDFFILEYRAYNVLDGNTLTEQWDRNGVVTSNLISDSERRKTACASGNTGYCVKLLLDDGKMSY